MSILKKVLERGLTPSNVISYLCLQIMRVNGAFWGTLRLRLKALALGVQVGAGVSAYVVDGLQPERLKPIIQVAMARFEAHQALRQELAEATQKLSERKAIDRAKGILMKSRGMYEDSAYAALRKLAMDRGKSLGAVAQDVIEMASILL